MVMISASGTVCLVPLPSFEVTHAFIPNASDQMPTGEVTTPCLAGSEVEDSGLIAGAQVLAILPSCLSTS